ncbi:MAG: methylated-DNA-protein-cysteine methyltransferase [Microgenomates group bacterium GW2011_GWA2_44_7]|nr:MAG: methylated-DNA-protein-cysteine methyltransferase [Microgenomates group bacterium GW2011_GWA2_44_7]KKT78250.1 MAG: methylated-DNA-protein-cysteine methyltransferase [Microgenomates group bacterium GW2011_GWB1_44_8]
MKGLFVKIRATVRKIPRGKVSTYGEIARMAGISDARKVGWALWGNQDPTLPCHRVVMKDGTIPKDYSLGGWQEQKARLVPEGVTFIKEAQADMKKHRWNNSEKKFKLSLPTSREPR